MKKLSLTLVTLLWILILFNNKVNAQSVTISGPQDVEPLTSFSYNYGATVAGLPSGANILRYEWGFEWVGFGYFTINNSTWYTSYNSSTYDSQNTKFLDGNPAEALLKVKVVYRDSVNHEITANKTIHRYGICPFYLNGPSTIWECIQPVTQYSVDGFCTCNSWPNMCANLTFAWTIPAGWAFSGAHNTNTINVIPNTSTGGAVSCTITRNGNVTKTVSKTVTRTEPDQHLDGLVNICPSATSTYTISSVLVLNGGTYLWQATGGYLFDTYTGKSVGPPNPISRYQSSYITNRTSLPVLAPSTPSNGSITISNVTGNLCHNIIKNITTYAAPAQPNFNQIPEIMERFSGDWTVYNVPNALDYHWSYAPVSGGTGSPTGLVLTQGTSSCHIYAKPHSAGEYIISVYASNECGNGPVTFNYLTVLPFVHPKDATTNINETAANIEFTIYPNPASNNITINLSATTEANYSVKLVNVLGEQVYAKDTKFNQGENSMNIDTKNLSNGIYNVIIGNGADIKMEKVIINH